MTFGGDGHVAQSTAASDAVSVEEPPFRSADSALRFALTREGRPTRSQLLVGIDTATGERSLAGLDGAAQAGIILAKLRALGPIPLAALIARTAPQKIPCHCRRPCCSGRSINLEWRGAIDRLTQQSSIALPIGSKLSYALRWAIIVKIYTGRGSFREIGDELVIDQETVGRQHRSILRWLMGDKKNGEVIIEGIEPNAWRDAESVLRDAGIVG